MAKVACPHEDELTSFMIGDLPTSRQVEISEHLELCTLCQPTLDGHWKKAKDDLSAALRLNTKGELFSEEPEFKQFVAKAEAAQSAASRNRRELNEDAIEQPESASETAQVHYQPLDYQRTTAASLDPNDEDNPQKTQSVHIPLVDDRRTTAASLDRPDDDDDGPKFGFLSLARPIKNWPQLQAMPRHDKLKMFIFAVIAVAVVAGIVIAIVMNL